MPISHNQLFLEKYLPKTIGLALVPAEDIVGHESHGAELGKFFSTHHLSRSIGCLRFYVQGVRKLLFLEGVLWDYKIKYHCIDSFHLSNFSEEPRYCFILYRKRETLGWFISFYGKECWNRQTNSKYFRRSNGFL